MARGVATDVLLLERPTGLDRVEVRRIWRQVHDADAVRLAGLDDSGVVMRRQVVHHEHVAGREARKQLCSEPLDETTTVGRFEYGCQDDPACEPDCTQQRQVGAPIHGYAIDELATALDPRMGPSHREIQAGFVEEDELVDRNSQNPPPECSPPGYDVGPQTLQWPAAFFLMTYP